MLLTEQLFLRGCTSTNFQFPFVTIEDVLVIDKNTILVANDNNYPGTGGRSQTEPDNTEILLLDLDKQLNLDPRVGINAFGGNELRFGTSGNDEHEVTRPTESKSPHTAKTHFFALLPGRDRF